MNKNNGATSYLDGIRGLAALGVFFHHFCLAFYSAYFTQKAEVSHLDGYEIEYSQHGLFSFINNGRFFVMIFFILSGFVLSRNYFRKKEIEVLVSGLHRRFIRLYIPIAFTLIISFLLLSCHAYSNAEASGFTRSGWFAKQWSFDDIGTKLLSGITYGALLFGDASFDTSLWTMSYEFFGSLFVFAFLIFTHFTPKRRLLMMILAMSYFFIADSPFYFSFVLGMTLCYTEVWVEKNRSVMMTMAAVVLLFAGLMMANFSFCRPTADTWLDNLKANTWDYTKWCLPLAGYFVVLAFVLSSPLQKTMSIRPLRFMGYISFSLYLLHPLLLGSFTSWLFLWNQESLGYNLSALIAFLTTIPLLILASWLMAKYVDQFGIELARKVYRFMRGASPVIEKTVSVEVEELLVEKKPAKAKATMQ